MTPVIPFRRSGAPPIASDTLVLRRIWGTDGPGANVRGAREFAPVKGVDIRKHCSSPVTLFEWVAELADRPIVRRHLAIETGARKAPHRLGVEQHLLLRQIRQSMPVPRQSTRTMGSSPTGNRPRLPVG